jgi:hypothetical protein
LFAAAGVDLFCEPAMPKKKAKKRQGKIKKGIANRRVRQFSVASYKAAIENKPPFRDEALAPKVDYALIKALVRRELSPADARAVYRLVYSFKSWSDAHIDALVRDFQRAKAVSI